MTDELSRATAELAALANLIERPPLDAVLLEQNVALRSAAAMRTVLAALQQSADAREGGEFREWLATCLNAARYNMDAADPKAAEILSNVLVKFDALAAAPPQPAGGGGWDHAYRPLKMGETILTTDECRRDDGSWVTGVCVGDSAPDPNYTSHRIYRRKIATPTPADPEPIKIGAGGVRCTAAPDHADIMETIENAADDWRAKGYTSALAEVRDMANVGRALMEALPEGYHYNYCPSEIVADLQNERDEALAAYTPSPTAAGEGR